MKVRKTAWISSENCPGALVLAMMEAKVPGDAKIIEMETGTGYVDYIYHDDHRFGTYGYPTVVKVENIKFLFEWYREEDREGTIVVPPYERKRMI